MNKIIKIILLLLLFAKPVIAAQSYPMKIRFLNSYNTSKLQEGDRLEFELYEDLYFGSQYYIPRLTRGFVKVVDLKNTKAFGKDASLYLGEGSLYDEKLKKHKVNMSYLQAVDKLAVTDVVGVGSMATGGAMFSAGADAGGLGGMALASMALVPLALGAGIFLGGKALKGQELSINSKKVYSASFEFDN